jgi:hypothetical protein
MSQSVYEKALDAFHGVDIELDEMLRAPDGGVCQQEGRCRSFMEGWEGTDAAFAEAFHFNPSHFFSSDLRKHVLRARRSQS